MKSKVVAILETRTGEHLGELIARRGGIPLLAPALEEVPDVDPEAVAALLAQWRTEPFNIAIFQTGVGTRGLFQATDAAGLTAELLRLLESSTVVVRGPKPVGELNARAVRIDLRAATPFTTEAVLAAVSELPMQDARVLVQRYGAANQLLRETLQGRGAFECGRRGIHERSADPQLIRLRRENSLRIRTREPAQSGGGRLDRPGMLTSAAGAWGHADIRSRSSETRSAGSWIGAGIVGVGRQWLGRSADVAHDQVSLIQ
jgi:hypothetical protein